MQCLYLKLLFPGTSTTWKASYRHHIARVTPGICIYTHIQTCMHMLHTFMCPEITASLETWWFSIGSIFTALVQSDLLNYIWAKFRWIGFGFIFSSLGTSFWYMLMTLMPCFCNHLCRRADFLLTWESATQTCVKEFMCTNFCGFTLFTLTHWLSVIPIPPQHTPVLYPDIIPTA